MQDTVLAISLKRLGISLFLLFNLMKISVVAQKMPDFAPPPSPSWQKYPGPLPSVDLNGVWETQTSKSPTPGSPYIKVDVFQMNNIAEAITLEGKPYPSAGEHFFTGVFTNPPSPTPLSGFVMELKPSGNNFFADTIESVNTNILVDNENQFHIDNVGVFHRLSHSTVQDIPCDPKNPLHISAKEALYRGFFYGNYSQGAQLANCWYYISAVQGHANGQLMYAKALYNGTGVQKDLKQALWWFQQSAMQGNFSSAVYLASMFKAGEAPASTERYYYWKKRAEATNPRFIHDEASGEGKIPAWALQTSGPCDPANPTHADLDRSFGSGRVAYQARAMDTAACWFSISASYNNLRAQVYLGILSLYGFGVPIDPPKGFAYMKKSAEGGNPFGKAYLSIMYTYGMGTPKDKDKGNYWFTQVVGSSAWDAVMSRRSISQITANAAEALPDNSKDIADCEQQMYKDFRTSTTDAKEACSSVSPLDVLAFGRASGRNTMMMPEEIYPEGLPYTYP